MRFLGGALWALALGWAGTAAAQSTQTYIYDANGRLIGVATATGVRGGGTVTEYDYDDADNRTERQAYAVTGPSNSYQMTNNQTLVPHQWLTSPSGSADLVLQQNGDLAVYCGSTPKWSAGIVTGQTLYFRVQADGNMVLFDVEFQPIWSSNTSGNPGAVLTLHNSGNLILRNAADTTTLWQSSTSCP